MNLSKLFILIALSIPLFVSQESSAMRGGRAGGAVVGRGVGRGAVGVGRGAVGVGRVGVGRGAVVGRPVVRQGLAQRAYEQESSPSSYSQGE